MSHLTDVIEEQRKVFKKHSIGMKNVGFEFYGYGEETLNLLIEQAMTKAALSVYDDILSKLDGYKIIDGISFDGSLPPADIFAEMIDDTNMIRDHVNGVIDFIKADVIAIKETLTTPKE